MTRFPAACVAALALALVPTAQAAAAPRDCEGAKPSSAPTNATGLMELEPNANRPTFDIALDDHRDRDNVLQLARKGKTRLQALDAGADLIEFPRTGTDRLDGALQLAAKVNPSQTRVEVYACLTSNATWDAGRYEGTFLVYGPNIQDPTYAIVVTAKWPFWVAIVVLAAAVLLFLLIAWTSDSLTFQNDKQRKLVPTLVGVAFAIGAAVPVYVSSYASNPTWGSDPATQLLALGTAGLTAATAGLAAAHRLFGGKQEQ